jgi:Mrp family chromosome partitioning ATPase/capsular polysaccharide biosynthesis protein
LKLTDYIRVIRQRLALAIVIVICVAMASLVFSLSKKPVYEASTRLRVRPLAPGGQVETAIGEKGAQVGGSIATEAELIKSTKVAERVLKRVPMPGVTPDSLLKLVTTTGVQGTEILIVTADTGNPQLSQNLSNAFAQEYVAVRRADAADEANRQAEHLRATIKANETRIDDITKQLRTLSPTSPDFAQLDAEQKRLLSIVGTDRNALDIVTDPAGIDRGVGEIVQAANTAGRKGGNSPSGNLMLGLLVGIPMALGIILLLDTMSDTIRTKEDAESTTEAPVLGLVPFDPEWDDPDNARLASKLEPFSPVAEAHRALRLNIENATQGTGMHRVMVTSAGAGEGKSATAANLALAFADAKRPVVLVDADLRRPRAHQFFGAEPVPGLVEVLEEEVDVDEALQQPQPDLRFLPCGAPSERPDLAFLRGDLPALFDDIQRVVASAELHRRRPARRAGSPNGSGDTEPRAPKQPTVLLDAPPVLQAAEVSALAPLADGVVLVIQAGVTPRLAASRAAEQIRRAGGTLLGVVLVGVRSMNEPGFGNVYESYRPRILARLTHRGVDETDA